jgi:aromatic-L-amino-acid/L-tryptophan decarboxylase
VGKGHIAPTITLVVDHPLEPSRVALEAMGAAALDFLVDFAQGRLTAPTCDLDIPPELLDRVAQAPSEEGRPFTELLDLVGEAATKGLDPAGPGYLAFVPGGGLVTAALAALLACGTNRFTNLAAPAPALVQMEASVLGWLCQQFGFPSGSQGIFTSGGSLSIFSAIVTARNDRLGDDLAGAALYTSDQAHHAVIKAARLAGLPTSAVRLVPCTADLHLDVSALEERLAADRSAGLQPFCVVANAGTVNTGAVDDLAALTELARRHDLWLHVDASYGGFFYLTERGRGRLAGIEQVDSLTLDPHKGLFLPYGTGCLLVAESEALRAAHSGGDNPASDRGEADDVRSYLRDLHVPFDLPDFADYSPELSREFRGLRVWLPLHCHGVSAFRTALDEKLDLAAYLYEQLRLHPHLDVPWAPELSIVAFRHRAGDDASSRLLERVNASRRVYLSSTVIEGRLILRACVLSFRTHQDRIDEAITLISDAASAIANA